MKFTCFCQRSNLYRKYLPVVSTLVFFWFSYELYKLNIKWTVSIILSVYIKYEHDSVNKL